MNAVRSEEENSQNKNHWFGSKVLLAVVFLMGKMKGMGMIKKCYFKGTVLTVCVAVMFVLPVLSFGTVDLTHGGGGYWLVYDAIDLYGRDWGDSDLYFTSQTLNGDIFDLTAYCVWKKNGAYWGTEFFTGSYEPNTMLLYLETDYIIDNEAEIGNVYIFDAIVDPNGYLIYDGVWAGAGKTDQPWSAKYIPEPAVQVFVDIKPGSCPNPLNTKSSGVLPVAILGSADLDVTTIDPTSILLSGVQPIRSSLEDVGTPLVDANDCDCTELGPDGLIDLTLKFETQAIVEAIGEVEHGDIRELSLTGILYNPASYEIPIEGADCIVIKGKHKPINKADINKDGVVNVVDMAIVAENWLESSIVE